MTPEIEDFRKTAPAPLAPRSINLPNPAEHFLSNGLKVVVVEDSRLPLVSFRLAFRTGKINDPQGIKGLTSTMTEMLTEGTARRTSFEIAEEVDRLGGGLSASASGDNTIVSASALSIYQKEILDLMADILLNPSFPENELALIKENKKQNLIMQRSQPNFLADERQMKVLFGEHPYAIITSTAESIDRISTEKLKELHKKVLIPNNAVFVAVGDLKTDEFLAELESLLGNWEKNSFDQPEFAAMPEKTERKIYLVHRPDSAQSFINLGNLGMARNNPDYFPTLLMNQVLGGGSSSRLFMNIREEKGYTYGAYTDFDVRRLGGIYGASAEVRSEVTGAALKEFFYEFERIRREEIPEQELIDAKSYLTGVFPLRLETQEGLTNQVLSIEINDLPKDYLQTYCDNINAVTLENVQAMAQKYLKLDEMAIVVVGDKDVIKEQIQEFAPSIETFDADGNSIG